MAIHADTKTASLCAKPLRLHLVHTKNQRGEAKGDNNNNNNNTHPTKGRIDKAADRTGRHWPGAAHATGSPLKKGEARPTQG